MKYTKAIQSGNRIKHAVVSFCTTQKFYTKLLYTKYIIKVNRFQCESTVDESRTHMTFIEFNAIKIMAHVLFIGIIGQLNMALIISLSMH